MVEGAHKVWKRPNTPFFRMFHVKHDDSGKCYSVLAPLSGELPKAEGEALAIYFAMNISSVLGDTCFSR